MGGKDKRKNHKPAQGKWREVALSVAIEVPLRSRIFLRTNGRSVSSGPGLRLSE